MQKKRIKHQTESQTDNYIDKRIAIGNSLLLRHIIWRTVIVKSQLQDTKHFFILYAFCIRILFVDTQKTTGLTYADEFKRHLTHLIGYPKSIVNANTYEVITKNDK